MLHVPVIYTWWPSRVGEGAGLAELQTQVWLGTWGNSGGGEGGSMGLHWSGWELGEELCWGFIEGRLVVGRGRWMAPVDRPSHTL